MSIYLILSLLDPFGIPTRYERALQTFIEAPFCAFVSSTCSPGLALCSVSRLFHMLGLGYRSVSRFCQYPISTGTGEIGIPSKQFQISVHKNGTHITVAWPLIKYRYRTGSEDLLSR